MKLLVPELFGEVFGEIADLNIFNRVVKHQGDAICGVIAKTEEAAERAAEKIKVTYEPLPIFMTAEASKAEGKRRTGTCLRRSNRATWPLICPSHSSRASAMAGTTRTAKPPSSLFAECDYIIEDTFYVPKQKQCQMENHSYVAHYDERGRLNIWTSTQMAKPVQVLIAELFELPLSRVRLVQTTVGGGFGVRLGMIGEPHACAMAMAVPGHPVRTELLREEDWVASETRYPGHIWMKMGFKKDGTPVCGRCLLSRPKRRLLYPWFRAALLRSRVPARHVQVAGHGHADGCLLSPMKCPPAHTAATATRRSPLPRSSWFERMCKELGH